MAVQEGTSKASRKIALVTGSTSGIGLAIAKTLAPKVDGLLLHGLATEEQVKSATEAVKAANPSLLVEFHGANLAVPEEIRSMIEFCKEKFEKTPDILVNNAGASLLVLQGRVRSHMHLIWNDLYTRPIFFTFTTSGRLQP